MLSAGDCVTVVKKSNVTYCSDWEVSQGYNVCTSRRDVYETVCHDSPKSICAWLFGESKCPNFKAELKSGYEATADGSRVFWYEVFDMGTGGKKKIYQPAK